MYMGKIMIKILLLIMFNISLFASIGNIMVIKGEAQIKRDAKVIDAYASMSLVEKDEIITQEYSMVQVILKDETVITIGANSTYKFEEYTFDGTKKSKTLMKASRGFFRSVTGKLSKIAPERFKVSTSYATIGIRGTDFSVDIGTENEIINCNSGVITIEFRDSFFELEEGMLIELSQNKPVKIKKMASIKQKSISKTVVEKEADNFIEELIENQIEEIDKLSGFNSSEIKSSLIEREFLY